MAITNYSLDSDVLRSIAVLAVVLHHLSASLIPGGYVGIYVFFVIFGYLIARVISREMKEGTFTFAGFHERRVRRIFLVLFGVLELFRLLVHRSEIMNKIRGLPASRQYCLL